MHMAEESPITSTTDLVRLEKSMSGSSNSSTMQGRSLIPRATNAQNEKRNDDDAKRSSSVASERAVATSTPDSPRNPRETKSSTPQEEHFQDCLKLYAENKINENNTWNLDLIDIMASMMQKRDSRMDSLQTASTVLAASARIYSSRVDAVYSDVLKMVGRTSEAAQKRNDDDAKRSSAVASKRAVATSTPDSPRSPRETMSSTPQEEHFQECLKLYAENKINENNTWNLDLIDIMASMMQKRDSRMDSLQTASTVLAASARIYSSRVDAVYSDVLKMVGRTSEAAQKRNDDDAKRSLSVASKRAVATSTPDSPRSPRETMSSTPQEEHFQECLKLHAENKRNDDDAKRSSSVASERAVATSTPDSPRSPRETMSSTPQEEHFQECLKLYAENKINENNAWNLDLIDIMASMMRKRDSRMDNLQTASTVLAASARIYSSRVDAVYSDVLKMVGRTSEAAQDDEWDYEDGAAAAELHAQAPAAEPEAIGDMLDLRAKDDEWDNEDGAAAAELHTQAKDDEWDNEDGAAAAELHAQVPAAEPETIGDMLDLRAKDDEWDNEDGVAAAELHTQAKDDEWDNEDGAAAAELHAQAPAAEPEAIGDMLDLRAKDDEWDYEDGAAAAELHAQAPAAEPEAIGDMLDLRAKDDNWNNEDGAAAAELHAQAPAAEPETIGDMLDLRAKDDEWDNEDGAAAAELHSQAPAAEPETIGDMLDLAVKVAKIFIPHAMRAKKVDMTQLKRCTGKLLTENSEEDEEV